MENSSLLQNRQEKMRMPRVCRKNKETTRTHTARQNSLTVIKNELLSMNNRILGHFDVGFMLRAYTHVTRQMQENMGKTGNFMAQVM